MRNTKMTMAVLALAMAMVFGACGGDDAEKISGGITPIVSDEKEKEESLVNLTEDSDKDETGRKKYTSQEIYKMCEKSVVLIDSGNRFGTGFFVEEDVILINCHVIDGASQLYIKFVDGQKYLVSKILGYDEKIDLALLKVECKGDILESNTHGVTVGETTYTIGNSLGIEHTFSDGIVTNKDLYENGVNYILTNTPISSGNSGGPLLNEYGEVIGVTTLTFTEGQNLNCAVDICQLEKIDRSRPVDVETFINAYEDMEGAEEAPEVTGKTTSLGRVQGGMYVNEYMGVSCTLDSGWEFYTAEELQEFPENVAEMFEGTDMEDEMSQMSYITDMSAENQEDFTSMNIIYEKLDLQQRLMLGSLSSSDIVDSMLLYQKDTLVTTYAQAGINVLDMAKKSVEFCGETIDGLYMSCDVSGIPYYTLQIFDYSLGDYAVTLTLASFVEDKTAELATLYAKYE